MTSVKFYVKKDDADDDDIEILCRIDTIALEHNGDDYLVYSPCSPQGEAVQVSEATYRWLERTMMDEGMAHFGPREDQ